jgi:mannose-6-phosphate isomerase-like protein (cupin superfamily)
VIDAHGRWADAVRKVAASDGVPLLDLDRRSRDWIAALGPEASKAWYLHDPAIGLADDTHFHERGATAVACLVVAGLIELAQLRQDQTTRDTTCGVPADQAARHAAQRHPSVIRHADAQTVVQALAPHGGSGLSIASPLFADQPELDLVVRRRVLTSGASIGLHAHGKDEIYYVLSGHGELTLDGKAHQLVAGHAVLTRNGSSHSLRQTGSEPLVILILYRQAD